MGDGTSVYSGATSAHRVEHRARVTQVAAFGEVKGAHGPALGFEYRPRDPANSAG